MARKLFALENLDEESGEAVMGDEAVGEAAGAENEVVEDVGPIEEDSGAVDDALGATEDAEKVESLVESSIGEGGEGGDETVGDGEGLDEVAAEAIRIAMECICSKVGYSPKSIYSLYATENFRSASSRKANTSIALEGVKDFLKDLWKKIKDTLTNIWTKVKAFWAKHVSTLGRVKKALDSMKAKVSESSGKLKGQGFVDEAPSSLVDAFAGADDINGAVVKAYITSHDNLITKSGALATKMGEFNGTLANASAITEDSHVTTAINKLIGATSVGPIKLVGGINYSVTVDKTTDAGEGGVSFEINKETIETKETKLGITILAKEQVKSMLTDTLALINDTIKVKDKMTKYNDAVSKFMTNISKAVEENATGSGVTGKGNKDSEKMKPLRLAMRQGYKINAKMPSIFNDQVGYNIKLAKAVLTYSAFCVKNYK